MLSDYGKCKTPFGTSTKIQLFINLPTPWPMKNIFFFSINLQPKKYRSLILESICIGFVSCPVALLHQQYIKDIFPWTLCTSIL